MKRVSTVFVKKWVSVGTEGEFPVAFWPQQEPRNKSAEPWECVCVCMSVSMSTKDSAWGFPSRNNKPSAGNSNTLDLTRPLRGSITGRHKHSDNNTVMNELNFQTAELKSVYLQVNWPGKFSRQGSLLLYPDFWRHFNFMVTFIRSFFEANQV